LRQLGCDHFCDWRYRCGQRTNAWIKLKSPAAIERDRRRVAATLRWAA
jgi:hypothetical protein